MKNSSKDKTDKVADVYRTGSGQRRDVINSNKELEKEKRDFSSSLSVNKGGQPVLATEGFKAVLERIENSPGPKLSKR